MVTQHSGRSLMLHSIRSLPASQRRHSLPLWSESWNQNLHNFVPGWAVILNGRNNHNYACPPCLMGFWWRLTEANRYENIVNLGRSFFFFFSALFFYTNFFLEIFLFWDPFTWGSPSTLFLFHQALPTYVSVFQQTLPCLSLCMCCLLWLAHFSLYYLAYLSLNVTGSDAFHGPHCINQFPD